MSIKIDGAEIECDFTIESCRNHILFERIPDKFLWFVGSLMCNEHGFNDFIDCTLDYGTERAVSIIMIPHSFNRYCASAEFIISEYVHCESELKARNAQLLEALTKAHEILLHEMDNGRTPTMLQGVGLGYFEDVIAGLDHPRQRD